jgi:hypothetical protein
LTDVWACGGGVQSSAIAALIVQGKLRPDLACIVDTGREQSTTWIYMIDVIIPALATVGVNLERVRTEDYATVDLYGGANKDTLLLPAFTDHSGEIGKLPTYCSNEWKTRVMQRWMRAKNVTNATVWLGISADEKRRMKADKGAARYRHPLIELAMNRGDCIATVLKMGWPMPPRSSCWMCPNHTQEEWRDIRENKPQDWQQAIQFDRDIRKRDPNAYLHGDCRPLEDSDFTDYNESLFSHCDSGMCFV